MTIKLTFSPRNYKKRLCITNQFFLHLMITAGREKNKDTNGFNWYPRRIFFSQFAWSRGNGNGAHLMRHLIEALNFNVLDKPAECWLHWGVWNCPGDGRGSCIDLCYDPSNPAISFTLHIVLSVLQQSVKSLYRSELLETCLSFWETYISLF